nr:hypothetical protein [Paraburkholderia flava]
MQNGLMSRSITLLSTAARPVQLLGRQFNHGLLPVRPYEVVLLKTPQHQPESGAPIEQQLDPVADAIVALLKRGR